VWNISLFIDHYLRRPEGIVKDRHTFYWLATLTSRTPISNYANERPRGRLGRTPDKSMTSSFSMWQMWNNHPFAEVQGRVLPAPLTLRSRTRRWDITRRVRVVAVISRRRRPTADINRNHENGSCTRCHIRGSHCLWRHAGCGRAVDCIRRRRGGRRHDRVRRHFKFV